MPRFRRASEPLGPPFTARLMRLSADRLTPGTPHADWPLRWPGHLGPSGPSVPLRLTGALHGRVLEGTVASACPAERIFCSAPLRGSIYLPRYWPGPVPRSRPRAAFADAAAMAGERRLALGRADFHGRWVDWRAPPPPAGN